ncbi:MAG: DM13 domain-containing protein [Vicinamibacteria bacterium]|jgi:hypothetical protein|nr:DM13 domain-containing protein [Vicinamibacteria bacterium]
MPTKAPLASILVFLLVGCGGSSPSAPTGPPQAAATPTPAATPSPTPVAAPTPTPEAGFSVLRTARIRGAAGHAASGNVRIVRENGRHRLEFLADFRIDSGNNDVYLARQSDTVTAADLNLGDLRSTRGEQSYDLPDAGSQYGFVVIWCRPFRIPIGLGELQ